MAGCQVVGPIYIFTNDGINVLLAVVRGFSSSIQVVPAPFSVLRQAHALHLSFYVVRILKVLQKSSHEKSGIKSYFDT